MFKPAMLCATFLGAVVVASPAYAQPTVSEVIVRPPPRPGAEVRTKVVNYRDLNISTAEGVQTLLGRIRLAAQEVCRPGPDPKNLPDVRDYDRCNGEAMNSALAQVSSAELNALYARVR